MPTETRYFVKAAVSWLLFGFALGAILLIAEALGKPMPPFLSIEHAHVEFVGWLVNMVAGFSLWMLPLDRQRFPNTSGRYPVHLAMLSFLLLNGGLLARILAEPWLAIAGRSTASSTLLIGAALAQLVAVMLFVVIVWTRIRPARALPSPRG